jgi:hypothetical protein
MGDVPRDQEALDRYWAEREQRELFARRRQRRWERRRYLFGLLLVWASTIVLAFGVGYSLGRILHRASALIGVWAVMGLLLGGLILMAVNGHGGEGLWIEDPDAGERWHEDLRRDRLFPGE